MLKKINYINRRNQKLEEEHVYGGNLLAFLYGSSLMSRIFGRKLQTLLCCSPLFSKFYGSLQRLPSSKKKILPFIKKFHLDTSEFQDPVESFSCFNDFFTRKLQSNARPIDPDASRAIIPADGRYLFYPDMEKTDGFIIKNKKFCLKKLLQDNALAQFYKEGSMVIARLCPTDYHRFHFPADAIPGPTKEIKGHLYSVNPMALRQKLNIFAENKRTFSLLETKHFGQILFMEVGATCVGTIHQTYLPGQPVKKGDEKGYFSFGGSTLVLLFEKNRIQFDADLLEASKNHTEILCLMGESMGRILTK